MDATAAVLNIIEETKVGTMATIQEGKPTARYMTFYYQESRLHTITSKLTEKVEEMKQNPHTHILIGYNGEGLGDAYVEIKGTVTFMDNNEIKQKIWNDALERWFDGPQDPDLLVIQVTPSLVRLHQVNEDHPITVTL